LADRPDLDAVSPHPMVCSLAATSFAQRTKNNQCGGTAGCGKGGGPPEREWQRSGFRL